MKLRGGARVRELLEKDKEKAFLSRDLATVKRDVPIDTGFEELKFIGFNREKSRELFTELGFNNLIKLIDNGS
jgi:DNA polymerase-1